MAIDTLTMTARTPHAAADARHELTAHLDRWSCERTADSLLVFSELVTNAINHAAGATRMVVVHGHHTLRFEVHDNTHGVPAVRDVTGRPGGFGLRIVDQLSKTWGWDQTATGKIVWSNLDCCTHNRPSPGSGEIRQPRHGDL